MNAPQAAIVAIVAVTIVVFLWGRWRHDMVAVGSLLACVIAGLVPPAEAFAGFGHPAVITVAAVLVLSRALQNSGAIDVLTRMVLPQSSGPIMTSGALTGLAAVLSAFMNNVGALALLMPIAIQIAARQGYPPGKLLMPLAFGSMLGGMTTLIGTPPNLIVSAFRAANGGSSYAMFDFTPVGAVVAACGVLFVAVAARWLVPSRKRVTAEEFDSGTYLTEARVPEKAKAAGMTLHEIERALDEADAQIIGFVRRDIRIAAPERWRRVQPGDVLIIEADPKALASVLSSLNLELEETVRSKPDKNEESIRIVETTGSEKSEPEEQKEAKDTGQPDEITLTELAILPESALLGRSASDVRIRTRFGVNLLAISRQGRRSISRLRTAEMHAGDVLLMQGTPEAISEFANQFACVPLAQRALRLPDNRQALTATGIMAVAIAGAAFGLVPAAIAFIAGVLAAMATRIIPPRTVYEAVDWPVIVLLGALIPVAGAMATTGAADLIAHQILGSVAHGDAFIAIVVVLILTMTLSDFMNNAATAAVMCPIAIGAAAGLGVSADPFLMAVAVGASCAFLTPIGHQNNTLILGPGGFRFGDYWRMGLPLEVIVIAVGAPMLLHVWPL